MLFLAGPYSGRVSRATLWLRSCFSDGHFRSMLRNSGYLAGSRAIAAVAGLVTLALTGRALGVVLFGTLVLINSYAQTVSGISKFQSWQLVVHYGSKTLSGGEAQQFKQSVGFAIGLDLAGGLAGMALGILLVPILAPKFGIPHRYVAATMLYCTLVPVMVTATASGVLRCLDRFDLIAWQGAVQPIVRAILVAAAWLEHAGVEAFLAIWFVTTACAEFFLWVLAWRELRRQRLLGGIRPTLRSRSLIGAWRFAINININTALLAASEPMGRLLVGGLLGPAGAALYRAASVLTSAIQKPADLLAKSFYPEVARLDPRSKAPWVLMIRSSALASAVALPALFVLVLAGRPLIGLVFGRDFVGAYEPLLVLAIVPLINTMGFPLPWMLYALDRPHAPAIARIVGTVVYLASVAPLTWSFGLIGAAGAFAAGNAVRIIVMMLMLSRVYRRMSDSRLAPAPEPVRTPAE